MIKHGKVHQFYGQGKAKTNSHLEPIKEFITKGIADAREKVVIQPLACDVKGAKRYNGQQCVIARAINRVHKPQAVAVGRAFAYAVFDGLAVRFVVPDASRRVIEEFDSNGRVRKAPIELHAIPPSWQRALRGKNKRKRYDAAKPKSTRKPTKRYGVRAIGGGVVA